MTWLRFQWGGAARRFVALSTCGVLAYWGLTAGACAAGKTEDGGAGGFGGSGGQAGAGGEPAATSTGGGGQGGVGGEAPMCERSPCKLTTPQCGCEDGDKCHLQSSQIVCVEDGSGEVGLKCDNDCAAGHLCWKVGSLLNDPLCRKLCETVDDCDPGPGSFCMSVLPDFCMDGKCTQSGEDCEIFSDCPPRAGVCTENCDPVSDVGCLEPDMKCDIGSTNQMANWFTFCNGSGTKAQGEACTNNTQCLPGHSCITVTDSMMNQQQLCLAWCIGPPTGACPANSQCSPFNVEIKLGNVIYGTCVPTTL